MEKFQVKSADFVAQPNPDEPLLRTQILSLPNNLGSIFSCIRLLGKVTEDRSRLANLITEHLKRLQSTLNSEVNIPRRFEQVLQAINEDMERFASEKTSIPLSDVHAVIGIIHENQIFMSGTGRLQALFMHRTAKQRYVLYELDAQFKSEEDTSWNKLFNTVLDGELHPGDVFYLGTRVSAHEISLADLQDTLVTLPPSGALKRIQQHLNMNTAYGAVCLRMTEPSTSSTPKKTNPITSIEHLGQTKEDTATILGEQSPDVGGFMQRVIVPLLKNLSAPGTRGTRSVFKRTLRNLIKILVVIFRSILKFLQVIYLAGTKIVSRLLATVTSKEKRERTKDTVKNKAFNLKASLKSLPRVTKYIALAVVLITVILSVTLTLSAKRKNTQEAEAAFVAVVERIEEKKDAADASLIYNNQDDARALLTEAVSLLETLPTETSANEAEVTRLRDELNDVLIRLRGATAVELTTLVNLHDQSPEASFNRAIEIDGVIYGLTANNELYRFQELEQNLLKEDVVVGAIGTVQLATPHNNGFLFTDANNRLGRANVTNNTLNPIVSGIETLQSVEAIGSYNDNLYVLTATGQQIVKMRPQGEGYDAGTAWITAHDADLTTARDLAIDGDIYILTENDIIKFTSGREQELNLSQVDPSLQNPTKIWTALGYDYFYLLEPTANRVLVFRKTGEFVTQYVNDAFANAVDFIIREDKKTILVVTDSQIVSFTATHLLQ